MKKKVNIFSELKMWVIKEKGLDEFLDTENDYTKDINKALLFKTRKEAREEIILENEVIKRVLVYLDKEGQRVVKLLPGG